MTEQLKPTIETMLQYVLDQEPMPLVDTCPKCKEKLDYCIGYKNGKENIICSYVECAENIPCLTSKQVRREFLKQVRSLQQSRAPIEITEDMKDRAARAGHKYACENNPHVPNVPFDEIGEWGIEQSKLMMEDALEAALNGKESE